MPDPSVHDASCPFCHRGHIYGPFRPCSCGQTVRFAVRNLATDHTCSLVCSDCAMIPKYRLVPTGHSVFGTLDVTTGAFRTVQPYLFQRSA